MSYRAEMLPPRLLYSVRSVLSILCTFKQSNKPHLSRQSGICTCSEPPPPPPPPGKCLKWNSEMLFPAFRRPEKQYTRHFLKLGCNSILVVCSESIRLSLVYSLSLRFTSLWEGLNWKRIFQRDSVIGGRKNLISNWMSAMFNLSLISLWTWRIIQWFNLSWDIICCS